MEEKETETKKKKDNFPVYVRVFLENIKEEIRNAIKCGESSSKILKKYDKKDLFTTTLNERLLNSLDTFFEDILEPDDDCDEEENESEYDNSNNDSEDSDD
jgi:hypothetical protein